MARATRTRRREAASTVRERPQDRPSTAASPEVSRLLMALLPLRFFAGGTFLYAGIDKFLNASFLRDAGPGSIAQQLEGFTRNSPLTPLIQAFALPHPTLIGALVAIGEIAVGLGVVSGVAYRLSAAGGVVIAALFFLTASWGTSPYYYGPDLPYAFGFLTLALVGRPGAFNLARSVDSMFEPIEDPRSRWDSRTSESADAYSPSRRAFLQSVVVGGAALVVGAAAFALTRVGGDTALNGLTPGTDNGAGNNGAGNGGSTPTGQGGGTGSSIGTTSQINQQGFVQFTDPSSGDPAYAISVNGQVVGYDATCTHQGCPVQYAADQKMFFCPCHGAEFDAAHGAQVVAGPARRPLSPIQLTVDSQGNVFVGA